MGMIGFHYNPFADTLEEQANKQGFTFSDKSEWIQEMADNLTCLYIQGCMTDSEHTRILKRFQQKILLKNLKRLQDGK